MNLCAKQQLWLVRYCYCNLQKYHFSQCRPQKTNSQYSCSHVHRFFKHCSLDTSIVLSAPTACFGNFNIYSLIRLQLFFCRISRVIIILSLQGNMHCSHFFYYSLLAEYLTLVQSASERLGIPKFQCCCLERAGSRTKQVLRAVYYIIYIMCMHVHAHLFYIRSRLLSGATNLIRLENSKAVLNSRACIIPDQKVYDDSCDCIVIY